jgi:prevent-host-death family protein
MATKKISAWEARRNFGKLLNEVSRNRQPVIVESHGEPVAAVVPLHVLRSFEQQRDRVFDTMQKAAERANMSEEDAMRLANEVIAEVRAEQHRADAG